MVWPVVIHTALNLLLVFACKNVLKAMLENAVQQCWVDRSLTCCFILFASGLLSVRISNDADLIRGIDIFKNLRPKSYSYSFFGSSRDLVYDQKIVLGCRKTRI